jgi:preprotein translocase subunit SecA
MTHALTRYHALYESLRTRRRRPLQPKGLDVVASRARVMIKHARESLGWLRTQAELTDRQAKDLRTHSDAALAEVVRECREVIVRGREDDAMVRRAFAAVREVARRETGEEAYLVQLMGAMALYRGRIIEMLTGEGKTLTGSIAAPILAWKHRSLHILTVNDYLAARDAESRAGIYARCGCDVGAIVQNIDERERFDIYARSIVYGTPKQITADWLRDQLRMGPLNSAWAGRRLLGPTSQMPGMNMGSSAGSEGPMIPGLRACMVDEADAVLIDEGVVPLIIARSRREDEMSRIYADASRLAERLDEGPDYTIDHLRRKADLSRRGKHRLSVMLEPLPDPIWRAIRRAEELVRQALVAKHCYLHGHQYQIVDGRVVIVDEYTGRFLPDRSWEHGLHQAVEAKEGLEVTADRETLARMSFQRYFRMYPHLAGMTGTAADASREMSRVYERPVSVIPTHRPIARERYPLRVFRSAAGKWNAIVDSAQALHAKGRPLLVGTRSIEASELISQRLIARGLEVRVLNANFDKDEAELIALAGKRGMITVATNMAGRGTDIKLDVESRAAGGLHVILTEMHTAKRIDRQFIGRAGRQGDPGSSQMFVSLEDELIRLHGRRGARAIATLASTTANTGEELLGPARSAAARLFRFAQVQAEFRGRRQRADVLRQDDWMERYMPGI